MSARAVAFNLFTLIAFALLASSATSSAPKAAAGNPVRIDHVELTNGAVNVHFYTEAGRSYTVQASSKLPAAETNWTNIFFARKFPFADHYIVPDPITNNHCVYRLYVVP